MKKKIVLLGAVAAASLATVSLASCKNSGDKPTTTETESSTKEEAKQTGISISGYKSSLILGGDIASTYKDAKVVANYSDGSTKDITDSVEFDTSKVDTSKVGPYPVYIKQGSYLTMYLVSVVDYTLESIEVDTTNFDTTLPLYSTFDFSSVVVKANYKNPADSTTNSEVVDHADVTFTVTNSANQVVTELTELGAYTVTVAFSGKTATFDLTCANPEVSTSVKDAVSQGVKSDASVKSGSYTYTNGSSDYQIKKDYTIGSNFVKLAEENIYYGSSYGVTTTYFSVASNGSAFAVSVDESGAVSKYYGDHAANVADAKAVGFDFFEDGGTVYPQYGFASVIAALYAKYEDTYSTESQVTKHESVEDVDGVKTYKFDFNDITNSSSAAHFTHYSVSFTLNAEGAIASANVSVEQYSLDDGYVEYNDLKSEGYTLPSELGLTLVKGEAVGGGEVYSFIIGDTATVSSTNTYVVTQTSGEKLAASENPYASDKVAISSFTVSKLNDEGAYEEMIEGATYTDDLDYATVSKDDGSHAFEFTVKVSDIAPETANSDLDGVNVTIKGTAQDGTVVDTTDWYSSTYNYAYAQNNYDNTYTLRFGRAGEYTVTISSLLVTKTYKFSIKDEAPTKITPLLQDGEANSNFQTVETFECYTTNSLYLDCSIASYYTQGYKLSVLELVGEEYVATENATVKKDYYEINGKSVECYKFTSTKAGVYKLVFVGATPDNPAKSAAEASIVVTVKDVPSVDDIVKGDHNYLFEATVSASEMYKVEFGAPDAENSGTITIWNKYDASKKQTGTYRYIDGQFVIDVESNSLGLADSATFDIEVTGYYGLKLKNSVTEATYTLGAPTSDITDSELALLKGKYEATSGTSTVAVKITPSSTVKGDGSIEITVSDETTSSTGVYDYTFNCTTKAIDLTPSGESNPFSGTIKVSGDKLVYVAEGSSSEVDFVSKGINIDEICSGNYTVTDGSGVNYTIKFADGQVTIKKLSNNRERICTYSYNESTGQLKLTKVSGSSSSVGLENTLYVIDGQLSYKGYKMGASGTTEEYIAVCVKEGGSSTEVVTIPTSVQGTWYGTYNDIDYTVTIDSSKVNAVSEDDEYTYTVKSVNGNVITLVDGSYTLTLTVSSSSIAYDDGYVAMTLSKTRTYKTPAGYDGKWSGTSSDGSYTYDATLTEGNTSVVIAVNDVSTTCKITNILDNVITVAYGNPTDWDYSEYTLTLGDGSIELIDSYFSNTVTLTAGSTVIITFSEEFIGSWSTANSEYYITISTDSITLNENDGTIVNYTEDDNTYEIDIYGTSYYVSYADGHVTLMGSSSDRHTYTLYKIPTGSFYVDKSGENSVIYVGSTTVAFDDYEYTISSIEASDSGDLTIIATDATTPEYQVKLTVVNGVVTGYAETSNGGTDWETYEIVTAGDVTFGEDYIGTWSNSDESSTLVITEDTVTYNGTVVEVTGDATDGYSFETTNAAGHSVTAYFWIEGETLTVSISADFVDYTKKLTFSEDYIGTWTSSDASSILVITKYTVTYNSKEVDVTYNTEHSFYEFTITNTDGTSLTVGFGVNTDGSLSMSINREIVTFNKVQ